MSEVLAETKAATKVETPTDFIWGETNGKKYKRGSRLPKAENPKPPAETPDVPWQWEEDGMTVTRGTARSGLSKEEVPDQAGRIRELNFSLGKALLQHHGNQHLLAPLLPKAHKGLTALGQILAGGQGNGAGDGRGALGAAAGKQSGMVIKVHHGPIVSWRGEKRAFWGQ